MRSLPKLIAIIVVIAAVVTAYSAWLNSSMDQTHSCSGLPGCGYTATMTCFLDGCIPVACPGGLCGGGIVTTTISSYLSSTQANQTLVGTVKIIPGTGAGVYFFDVGSVQYHLVFCQCIGTGLCNCPMIPALMDGQSIQVTGTVVTPSTYGSVWAPGRRHLRDIMATEHLTSLSDHYRHV